MSNTDKGLPDADDAPLSDEVLKAIVGGTRSEEAKPMDGERAAALTAGAEAGGFVDVAHHGFLPPGSHGPGTAMKAGASETAAPTAHADGSVAGLKAGASAEASSSFSAKAGGQGPELDKGTITVEQIAPGFQAQSGASSIKVAAPGAVSVARADGDTSGSAAETLATLDPDKIKEILADFRDIHGVKLKPGVEISKTYAGKSTEKDLANSSDDWTTTTKSTALDQQKAADKAAAETASKAQDAHLANLLAKTEEGRSQTAAQDGVKTAEQNVKTAFDQLVKAQQSVLKDGGDAVQHAQKLASLAQDIHAINTQTVKDAEAGYKNAIQADKPAHEIKKAQDAYHAALLDQQDSQKQLATLKDDLSKKVADKVQDKTTDLKKADDALAKARSDAGDETRPRANSAPTGSATEKPAADPVKSTGDAPSGHDVNAQVEKALREAQAAKAKAEADRKAEDAAKEQATKDAEFRQKMTGLAVKALDQALTDAAKDDSKQSGTYSKTTTTDVTHGGVDSETREENGVKVTVNTLAQTTLKHGGESWDSSLGQGKNAVWAPKAEVGHETIREFTDPFGNKTIVKDSVYAGAEFENKAGYSVTDTAINLDASSRLVGHAETKHSDTHSLFGLENTTEHSFSAHGEVGGKAGAHLGFDGVKGELAGKAEGTLSAHLSNETTIGQGKAKISGDVFLQAKAEAKVGGEVTFDPSAGKVKAKLNAGAEAGAGFGADLEGSLKSKDGNGINVGVRAEVGKVGGSFEPEVNIENGKVEIKLNFSGYVLVGGKFDISITGDYKKAGEYIERSINDIRGYQDQGYYVTIETNPLKLGFNMITGAPKAVFAPIQGFFS